MSRLYCALVVSALCSFTLSSAYAFVPSGFRWRLPVPYEINTGSSQELGQQTTVQVIRDSYANWTDPLCSGFRSEFRGETNGSWRSGDGMNTLMWFYDPAQRPREIGGQATIGVTLSVFRQDGLATDGDILFNGIDHSWTTNAVRFGQVDAVSIITHEVGHQLGLNHSPFQSATMYAAYLGGDGAATLDNDDIQGVCSLYPSGADADCDEDADCPAGQICNVGECVDEEEAGGGAIGDPCNQNQGCDPGLFCVGDGQGGAFCTRECGGGCPEGWMCQAVQFNNGRRGQICLPGQGEQVDPRGYGESCENSGQCASGFCISDGQNAFCTQACGSRQDCPPGSDCYRVQGGGGACIPVDEPEPVADAAAPAPAQDQFVPPANQDQFTPPVSADQGVPGSGNPNPGNGGFDAGFPGQDPTGQIGADGGANSMGRIFVAPATDGCVAVDGQSTSTALWLSILALAAARRRFGRG